MNKVFQLPRLFGTIRGKLVGLFLGIFGLSLVAVATISYQIFSQTRQADFDASLYNHAIDVASTIGDRLMAPLSFSPFSLPTDEKTTPFPLRRSFLQLRNINGALIAQSSNLGGRSLPISSLEAAALRRDGLVFSTISANLLPPSDGPTTHRFRLINYVIRRGNIPLLILQIAAPMTLVEQSQDRLLLLFLILIPLSLALSAVTGYSVAHRAFAPVRAMIDETSEIQIKNLGVRVHVTEEDPELTALATTLNDLLGRVEQAVTLQERFIADASHQLKTPLAIMKGEMEALLRDPAQPPQLRDALNSIGGELSQLIRLVENLLLLAKMDASQGVLLSQRVRLDELLMDAVAKLSRLAKEKEIHLGLMLSPLPEERPEVVDFETSGDPDLLRSLFVTLIENAIKYSDSKTTVSIRLSERQSSFVIEILDQGVGLATDEIERIFERFTRNPVQALKTPGSGLGLPIARRILELHRGTLSVVSEPRQGSTFRVEIKKT
jgi:signal transduction histidine kinase